MKEIIDLKKNHKNELLQFRQFIKRLITEINSANDEYEVKEYIASAKEQIELEIYNLNDALIKNKIGTLFTGLDTLLGIENPKFFDTIRNLGFISTTIDLKFGLAMASVGIMGKMINNKFFKSHEIKELDYLFKAKKEGIIK